MLAFPGDMARHASPGSPQTFPDITACGPVTMTHPPENHFKLDREEKAYLY